jgi:hypothetical protein
MKYLQRLDGFDDLVQQSSACQQSEIDEKPILLQISQIPRTLMR